jgi:hypothetical protein
MNSCPLAGKTKSGDEDTAAWDSRFKIADHNPAVIDRRYRAGKTKSGGEDTAATG